ncbi:T9SS type A sorting domain-containing protein [Barnesiella sp. ET7]|nr:T9SS type A sorting domain-containing protein [Barnesiella sp. ET7]
MNPGHGGWNGENDRNIETLTHALGDTLGFWESSSNLSKGLYLRDLLEAANATVYMSREDNRSGYRDNQYLPDDQQITDTGYGDRPLSTIAEEASANNVDAFLSIHSNAAGSTSAVNYLYLMCPGNGGEGDQNFRDPATKALADAAWPHIWNNPLTVWTHYTATNTKIAAFVTSYTVIGTALTVPGFLSEGEFHDYKPETHRLLNEDYRHLESLRFYYFYCDYFGADFPETGVLCGDVRDAHERLTEKLYTPYVNGSKDQYLPLNGAHVSLYDDSGSLCGEYTVDNDYNGVFAFWNLEPGNNTVVLAWEAPEGVEAAARYNVYRDDQLLETVEETTYTDTGLEAGKTYRYAVTAVYGDYETEPATETVSTVITGIEQTEQALTVYPNPTDGLVNIELAEPIQTIQVYDMNGRLVLRRDHLSAMRETIDLSDCKPGNYLLKVNSFTYRVIRK